MSDTIQKIKCFLLGHINIRESKMTDGHKVLMWHICCEDCGKVFVDYIKEGQE